MPVSSVDRRWAAERIAAGGVPPFGRTGHLVEVVAEARRFPGEVAGLIGGRKQFLAAAAPRRTVADVLADMIAR